MNLNVHDIQAKGLAMSTATVTKTIKKAKHSTAISALPKNKKNSDVYINSLVRTAKDLGNKQNYNEAVKKISEAIVLSPKRFDLILKRSFYFYQLAKFEKSIRDAKRVLESCPNISKGYYRVAECYFAMNDLCKAEEYFVKLHSFNAYTKEASKRLLTIRAKQLEAMGYHSSDAVTALKKSNNKTVEEAIDLLSLNENADKQIADESAEEDSDESTEEDSDESEDDSDESEYNSDESGEEDSDESQKEHSYESEKDDSENLDEQRRKIYKEYLEKYYKEYSEGTNGSIAERSHQQSLIISKNNPVFTDPSNPLHCSSLFVGNLKEDITYKEVLDVFSRFGKINNIKLISEPPYYCFVNFEDSTSAGQAMKASQGLKGLLSSIPLVVRYPTKKIITSLTTIENTDILRKLNGCQSFKNTLPKIHPQLKSTIKTQSSNMPANVPVATNTGKPRPPSMTKDCRFWATTGCRYGKKCFYLHRPECQGTGHNSKSHSK